MFIFIFEAVGLETPFAAYIQYTTLYLAPLSTRADSPGQMRRSESLIRSVCMLLCGYN